MGQKGHGSSVPRGSRYLKLSLFPRFLSSHYGGWRLPSATHTLAVHSALVLLPPWSLEERKPEVFCAASGGRGMGLEAHLARPASAAPVLSSLG